jgi:hypothetical protein
VLEGVPESSRPEWRGRVEVGRTACRRLSASRLGLHAGNGA